LRNPDGEGKDKTTVKRAIAAMLLMKELGKPPVSFWLHDLVLRGHIVF
jgi:hypothetical protein